MTKAKAGLFLVALLGGWSSLWAQARPVTEADLPNVVGDYRIEVHPDLFGFVLQNGKLHLKMGGVKGAGSAVPLLAQADGKFVLSEGHPNAFQFAIDGDQVKFTLWSAGNPIPGKREGGTTAAAAPAAQSGDQRTRADVLRAMADAERAHRRKPADASATLAYGKLLLEAGEFWTARDLMSPLTAKADASDAALDLGAKLEFLTGNYDAALALYDRLIAVREGKGGAQVMAMVGKMFAQYQRDDLAGMASLPFPAGVALPNVKLAQAFEGKQPYRQEWHNEEKTTEVPFSALDPLPQFPIEVNGVPLRMIYDTGGDILILDDEVAKALGVTSVASAMGTFGGGLQSEIGFGKVDRVKVGEVTLHDVPVMILPSKRFTFDKRFPVSGVFGTALTRQFLSTLDYTNQKLVLRERTAANAAKVRSELGEGLVAEIPFALYATHQMFAKGSLNGKDGLTYFIDSGLASDALFTAPIQALEYVGIPVPPTKMSEGVGGGGGKYAEGPFAIESLSLGPLRQTDVRGATGRWRRRATGAGIADFSRMGCSRTASSSATVPGRSTSTR
ncbi:MAG: aspartyl protease family protein [Gemmatimonadales bacterium]